MFMSNVAVFDGKAAHGNFKPGSVLNSVVLVYMLTVEVSHCSVLLSFGSLGVLFVVGLLHVFYVLHCKLFLCSSLGSLVASSSRSVAMA